MSDSDRFDLALDRYWDDLNTFNEGDAGDLGAETISALHQVHALAAMPIPIAARERVRSRLDLPSPESSNPKEIVMSPSHALFDPGLISVNGHRATAQPRPKAHTHISGGVMQRIAAATSLALILVILGTMFRSSLPWTSGPANPDGIPAAVLPATPSPGPSTTIEGTFTVDGHDMFISCAGVGSPTLVFLNEMDKASVSWGDIPAAFADQRVCVYDRAGIGKSQKMAPHEASQSVEDLHGLLTAAKVPGPYLLVGSHIGGLIASMYAGTYPSDVVGLVLVRPVHPWEMDLEAMLPQNIRLSVTDTNQMNQEQLSYYASLPEELALLPSVGDIPVVVLAGDNIAPPVGMANPDKLIAKAYEEYQRFADSFDQGTLIKVPSSAYVLHDAPDQVITQIQTMLDELATN